MKWEYKGLSGTISGADLAPRETGIQTIPAQNWETGSKLMVSFLSADNQLIDMYDLKIGEAKKNIVKFQACGNSIDIVEQTDAFTVKSSVFNIKFDKKTGLIKAGVYEGDTLIKGGPFLQYTLLGKKLDYASKELEFLTPGWKLISLNKKINKEFAEIAIRGSFNDSLPVSFVLTINGNGDINTSYSFEKSTKKELFELGIMYQLSASFDKLNWNRESYWSAYPERDLGRPSGEEPLRNLIYEKYREAPKKDWTHDVCNFYYKGIDYPKYKYHLPNIVTALKENIYDYTLTNTSSGNSVSVVSDASVACRVEQKKPEQLNLIINSLWDYPDLLWGNYMKIIQVPEKYGNEVVIKFNIKK